MRAWLRIPLQLVTLALLGLVAVTATITGGYYYVEPSLPEAAALLETKFQTPLRIYSRDMELMAYFGEAWRAPVPFEDIPDIMKRAVIAAEDARFFEHSGIDFTGILRGIVAAGVNFVTGSDDRIPGGSTITQQVARTAGVVGNEYSLVRKFREAIIAWRIEKELTKQEILGLFLNTTFLGQRAYGVASAAQRYFNKELDELTLGEVAIIAGIPQGPSIMNPYNGPDNARNRRAYVLRRLYELGDITPTQREAALAEPIIPQRFDLEIELDAGHMADWTYEWCKQKLGKMSCDEDGLTIVTTIDSRLQRADNTAIRSSLETYDRNHGYRGPIGRIDLSAIGLGDDAEADAGDAARITTVLDTVLQDYPVRFRTEAAVVLAVEPHLAEIYLPNTGPATISLDAVAWARRYVSDDRQGSFPETVDEVLTAGDIVRLRRRDDGTLELAQIPDPDDGYGYIQGALVSLDPIDGAVVALNGGYSFTTEDQYNRATLTKRQPGSSFKPFFYMSALAKGYTLASIVNDVGISEYSETLEQRRRVENYDRKYHGEVALRYALKHSLNAAADQVIRNIGASYAADWIRRFGFGDVALPRNASLALGSGGVAPLELAAAYSVLANGGFAVGIRPDPDSLPKPYFVDRVLNAEGEVIYDARHSVEMVCLESDDGQTDGNSETEPLIERTSQLFPRRLRCAERVASPQLVYLITDVLKEVITETSGQRADRAFPERSDLRGKTGTTNGPTDAWFAGFNADIVAVSWVGFDDNERTLGRYFDRERRTNISEQGGVTAIQPWIDFMKVALAGQPDHELPRPPGVVDLRINPETGLAAAECNRDFVREIFVAENVPRREGNTGCISPIPLSSVPGDEPDNESGPRPGSERLFE